MAPRHAAKLLAVEVPPGQGATDVRPGDFILLHGDYVVNHLIRLGQAINSPRGHRPYMGWDHVAMIVSPEGDIAEAVTRGVRLGHLDEYRAARYVLVRIVATEVDRWQAVNFARAQVGARYGLLTIASVVIGALTGSRLRFAVQGEFICSTLVARALERTGAMFEMDPAFITPANLARHYDVPYRIDF